MKVLILGSMLLVASGAESLCQAQSAQKYTCWLDIQGLSTGGADTEHGDIAPGSLRNNQGSGDHAFGYVVSKFPCPKSIKLPKPLPPEGTVWTPASADITW